MRLFQFFLTMGQDARLTKFQRKWMKGFYYDRMIIGFRIFHLFTQAVIMMIAIYETRYQNLQSVINTFNYSEKDLMAWKSWNPDKHSFKSRINGEVPKSQTIPGREKGFSFIMVSKDPALWVNVFLQRHSYEILQFLQLFFNFGRLLVLISSLCIFMLYVGSYVSNK
jgi:hypothetical protein